jgi:hypothetical protein
MRNREFKMMWAIFFLLTRKQKKKGRKENLFLFVLFRKG